MGEGEIKIRDEDKQQELEDRGETESVAELNRYVDLAQEITKDGEECVSVYVSDAAVKAAIEAGGKVAEVAELRSGSVCLDKLSAVSKWMGSGQLATLPQV